MKNINSIILIILAILFCNIAGAQTDFKAEKLIRKGNHAFADSNFTAAEENYQLAVLEDRANFKAKYNLANTLFRQERFEEAAEAFEEILDDAPDKTMRANIYHNMANSKLANQDLEGSIEDYKNALRLEPKMQDTRYNLSYAMKMKEQQDQQQQQENKDENKDNKENKDENKDQKDKNKDDQDKKDQDQKDKDNKDKEDQDKDKNDENSDDKNNEDKDKQDDKNQQSEEENKQKVDRKQAEQLLRAVAEKEKDTKEKLEKQKARVKAVKTEKDW